MAIADRINSTFRRIAANDKGTTAITFALSIVPLLLAGGAAIDYLRYAETETTLQAALDSGALAVGASSTLSHDARIKAGEDTFNRNLQMAGFDFDRLDGSFELAGNTVHAEAHYRLPTSLMQIAGITQMSLDLSTDISIPKGKKAEIALVLDYSGSMKEKLNGQVKYVAMKNAAKKLVDDLSNSAPDDVKFGLVPFSHHVWVSLPKSMVLGQSGAGDWTGCTQDRKYPDNLTDDTPTSDPKSKWGQPISPVHASSGCSAYVPNDLIVRPLTNDFSAIDSQLDAMKPYAWTHIALGVEFGFHLLSPGAPYTEATTYSDADTKKVMVILTDGEQTEPAFGPGGRSVAQGEQNLSAICDNAKAKGITVMTIAYNIDDIATVDRLRNCTSNPDTDFYNIDNGNKIAGAFENIKKQITAQVFVSR